MGYLFCKFPLFVLNIQNETVIFFWESHIDTHHCESNQIQRVYAKFFASAYKHHIFWIQRQKQVTSFCVEMICVRCLSMQKKILKIIFRTYTTGFSAANKIDNVGRYEISPIDQCLSIRNAHNFSLILYSRICSRKYRWICLKNVNDICYYRH